jgi:NTE family protein
MLKPGVRLVCVGGGFVGMEVAVTARELGVDVTVLESGPHVYRAFADDSVAEFFQKLLQHRGVAVLTGTRVARFLATEGRLSGVQTEAGQQIPADVAVVGVGAEPNTEWIANAGFQIDRGGVVVNVRLETPGDSVWAAGDVARFVDPVSKQPRRLEHWDNAYWQGKQAGRNMAGAGEAYDHQTLFFSDLGDVTINVLGDTEKPDRVEILGSTDVAAPRFTAYYARENRFVAAVLVNLATDDRTVEVDELQRQLLQGTLPEL